VTPVYRCHTPGARDHSAPARGHIAIILLN
jgi:hypothetical protein